jgi:pimeloyl-ACP methyl ester carboxylesterase
MPYFRRDGIDFHFIDRGSGTPVVLQHGLGGDVSQPAGLFRPPPGIRLLAFDFRAHGETRPLGDEAKIGIAGFADDLLAFLEHLGIERAVAGGISLGAAVALAFALRHRSRLLGLVLSRPAWLIGPTEWNARVYGAIAGLIREHGPREGLELFRGSADYLETLALSPDSAASLVAQFESPRAADAVVRLERLPRDQVLASFEPLERLDLPALVLATRNDRIHPFEFADTLARRLPRAELREMAPKSLGAERHAADFQAALAGFLERLVLPSPTRR